MRRRRKSAHIEADFSYDDLSQNAADARDRHQRQERLFERAQPFLDFPVYAFDPSLELLEMPGASSRSMKR